MPRWPTTHTRSLYSIRRYTELPFVLDMLAHRHITLLSPATWVDKNDAHFMSVYQQTFNLTSVLALCFTEAAETFHHWKIFSGSPSGICIEFKKHKFASWAKVSTGMQMENMSYRNLSTMKDNRPAPHHLPFIKRFAYRDEKEVRLLWQSDEEKLLAKCSGPIT